MRPIVLSGVVALLALPIGAGCETAKDPNPLAESQPVEVKRSAITEGAPKPSNLHDLNRPSDVGERPGAARPPGVAAPSALAASRNPERLANKVVNRPAPSVPAAPPPVSAEAIAKQNQYLRKAKEQAPGIAALSAEEQEQRRGELKRQVLGE
jgi:hypothetical protein